MRKKIVLDSPPYLSIIIPAFNEAERLSGTLKQIAAFVESRDFVTEVIVVDNGSIDATKDIIMDYHARHPFINYHFEPISGKGAAVRTGMVAAQGEYLLICDADLAVPVEEVINFLPPQVQNCEIVIGSREAEGARRYDEPFYRHLMGRVFNLVIRTLLLPGLYDTQCGFKCFRRDAAHELFSMSRINGWGFDVEILYIARLKGYRIAEVPVIWHYGEKSKVNPARDTVLMLKEVLEIRKTWKNSRFD